jgi:hypothetical protein
MLKYLHNKDSNIGVYWFLCSTYDRHIGLVKVALAVFQRATKIGIVQLLQWSNKHSDTFNS